MLKTKRLEKEREELEALWEIHQEKCSRLRSELAFEVDVARKFNLEHSIKICKAEIEQIEQDIETLEEQINSSRKIGTDLASSKNFDDLYKALLRLGYWEQERVFNNVTRDHSHSAFLIRGSSKEYGQRWLLNRLVFAVSKNLNAKEFRVDLHRKSSRSDIDAIWSEFAGRLNIPEESSPSQIVDNIYRLWQSQDVLINFNNVDESIKENLNDLLEDFWGSIARRILKNEGQLSEYKLLIFFLDYRGVVIQWDVGFEENYDSNWQPGSGWQPSIPLGLPDIKRFSDDLLISWIEHQIYFLPPSITNNPANVAQQIFQEKNGIPEPTLRKICALCGCNWFEQEEKWLHL
jgi:hypothetical protein